MKTTSLKRTFALLLVCMSAVYSVHSQSLNTRNLRTDKSRYEPGGTVNFTAYIDSYTSGLSLSVEYWNLTQLAGSQTVDVTSANVAWSWITPNSDFTGYTVVVKLMQGTTEKSKITTAVDVSSSWGKFPRYGFLSDYNYTSAGTQDMVLENLNRHHINGLQFYDCLYGHHKPIPDNANDGSSWKNVLNHTISFGTVKNYITKAHAYNTKAMFYDLLYGALYNSGQGLVPGNDGVKNEWYIYTDKTHTNIWKYDMSGTTSTLFHTDPSNTEWQNYLNDQMSKLYAKLDFDGFHMDQVGEWPTTSKYTYGGSPVNLPFGFSSFINKYKSTFPNKSGVLNAVSQYGASMFGSQNVDFMYSEVWQQGNEDDYKDVANVIRENYNFSKGKNSVLAAYINYKEGGQFNDASVLRFNAVAFAWGGSHIELGEHMLSNEYYPDGSMSQSDNLKAQLVKYYDFLTAYENLLRNGGIKTTNESMNNANIVPWDNVKPGTIASFNVFLPKFEVVHFLNFNGSGSLLWRPKSAQGEAIEKNNLPITFEVVGDIKNVYYASPDLSSIELKKIDFTQIGNKIICTLPSVKYWTMLVAERTVAADCPNNCSGVYRSKNGNMYIGGDFSTPAWSPGEQRMSLVANNTWKLTGVTLPNKVTNLAFTNTYSWGDKWGGTTTMSGIAKKGDVNMTFTPPVAGKYTFVFNDSTLAYSITLDSVYTVQGGVKSIYPSMNFAGKTFNNWNPSANPMKLVADYTWRLTGVPFDGTATEVVFTYNNWEKKFGGTTGMQGIAKDVSSGGTNILITPPSGTYTVTFNDKTLEYSIDFPTGVQEKTEGADITCYPNPMNDFLTINNPGNVQLRHVRVINLVGSTCIEKDLNSSQSKVDLDVSLLEPGVYFILIQSNNSIQKMKMVKIQASAK